MDNVTYSEARANLSSMMDKVCDNHAPIVITRQNSRSVVMMSLEEYQELDETAYLLRSPANAKRLMLSLEDVKKGNFTEVNIDFDARGAEDN